MIKGGSTKRHSLRLIRVQFCLANITRLEIKDALLRMKKRKAPGIDGLTVELYLHYWEQIENPLYNMFIECINSGEISTPMKQRVISLNLIKTHIF